MVRQVLLETQPDRSMRLAVLTGVLIILATVLPILLPVALIRFQDSGAGAGEQLAVEVSPYESVAADGESCWRAVTHTEEKNVFGATVMKVGYETQWCGNQQNLNIESAYSYVQERNLGTWELGVLKQSEYLGPDPYEDGETLQLIQPLSYSAGSASGSFTRCLILNLTEGGRAEAQLC